MKLLTIFFLVLILSGCHNYSTNVGDTLGCTLAGNGCVSEGSNGSVGPQGPAGQDGVDGTNGSSISVVKLCSGETVYPSVFVEVAFCIDGKLYATYSTHGGFSTEIPPGAYRSNTVGSRCDFVVEPLCVVRN